MTWRSADEHRGQRAAPQWSPLVKSGMTRPDSPPVLPDDLAAMEPAREERDDRRPGPDLPHRRVAAMEPAREERDDLFRPFPGEVFTIPPQWRPLVKSGMTGDLDTRTRRRRAAMEPAREERDDSFTPPVGHRTSMAAMEPAREERDDRRSGHSNATPTCRNGARS